MTYNIMLDHLEEKIKKLGFKIDLKNNLYYLFKNDDECCHGDLATIDGYIKGVWDTIYIHHRTILNGNLLSVWEIDDVKNEHENLTDEQCINVLNLIKENHDANIGINWEVIESAVSELYPDYE